MIVGGDQHACLQICGAVLVLFSVIHRSQHREPSDYLPRMPNPFTSPCLGIDRPLAGCRYRTPYRTRELPGLIADVLYQAIS
jgi:hypothetical protein